jgi:hypothetical protein
VLLPALPLSGLARLPWHWFPCQLFGEIPIEREGAPGGQGFQDASSEKASVLGKARHEARRRAREANQ